MAIVKPQYFYSHCGAPKSIMTANNNDSQILPKMSFQSMALIPNCVTMRRSWRTARDFWCYVDFRSIGIATKTLKPSTTDWACTLAPLFARISKVIYLAMWWTLGSHQKRNTCLWNQCLPAVSHRPVWCVRPYLFAQSKVWWTDQPGEFCGSLQRYTWTVPRISRCLLPSNVLRTFR